MSAGDTPRLIAIFRIFPTCIVVMSPLSIFNSVPGDTPAYMAHIVVDRPMEILASFTRLFMQPLQFAGAHDDGFGRVRVREAGEIPFPQDREPFGDYGPYRGSDRHIPVVCDHRKVCQFADVELGRDLLVSRPGRARYRSAFSHAARLVNATQSPTFRGN